MPGSKGTPDDAIETLHSQCGIYTKPEVVKRILNAVGWRSNANLSRYRLLEPAAGNGEFVIEAARRLVKSCARQGLKLTTPVLEDRIRAFEIHPREAAEASSRVIDVLQDFGVHHRTAKVCAKSWIINRDFLLSEISAQPFTHAVGNPPYVRWSKIPAQLKERYDSELPRDMTGGDLFLPFLDRAFDSLEPNGRCGFLCSDRWRFMAFAEAFRKKWLPYLEIKSESILLAADAFVRDVDSYPTILIASKKTAKSRKPLALRKSGSSKTLEELGCVVKVGPALGHTPAYVLEPDVHDVEPNLLLPWIDSSEITEGAVNWKGRHVIVMYGLDDKLIDLKQFPLLKKRLQRFRNNLKQRSIVLKGAPWFRPIDRVRATDWKRPKLVVPEIAKIPRLAIDRSGAIPSHGVYAIFAPDDDVDALYEKLRDGKLATALEGIAPRIKGGYVRCYKRFLMNVRIEADSLLQHLR